MTKEPTSTNTPTPDELRVACHTLLGMPGPNPELATKLRYVADLLTDAGPLPLSPLLVWREGSREVRHSVIERTLIVGRAPLPPGLGLSEDRLLSRDHFSVNVTEDGCWLRDLRSKNGTAVNIAGQPVGERLLRDGDLILAGNHIFAFLDQSQVA